MVVVQSTCVSIWLVAWLTCGEECRKGVSLSENLSDVPIRPLGHLARHS
jgi:hypothetical protein